MIENLIIISVIGLVVGFILSIPAGGPTSIVIITNALKGKTHYAYLVNFGACVADFVYVFISIYGLTRFYHLYQPYIPYIFLIGSMFVIFIGFKTFKTKHPLEEIDHTEHFTQNVKVKTQKGFLTGMMLGFLNPGLIMSWMASTLIVLSALNSYGFDTAGLEGKMNTQLKEVNYSDTTFQDSTSVSITTNSSADSLNQTNTNSKPLPQSYPLLLSLFYAFSISIGSVIWFYYVILFITKFRKKIKPIIIHNTIQVLGLILLVFGVILGYKGISMLVS